MMAHAEQLHALLTDARFEVVAWNDLTEPSTQVMHAFLNAPPQPLGLHVFVPDFRTKATNLVHNLDHNRIRLIQAVLHAPVVLRIFTMFLDGHGYLAIAERLTAEHLPPPSGHDRARNPHRLGVAWGKSAVRAILQNPRYTGYQVWNKQRRDEVLLDVDDVAAGHVSKMRWNPPDQWVYSAEPTHPPLVSRETFDQVQARIAARSRTSPAPRRPRHGRMCCGGGFRVGCAGGACRASGSAGRPTIAAATQRVP